MIEDKILYMFSSFVVKAAEIKPPSGIPVNVSVEGIVNKALTVVIPIASIIFVVMIIYSGISYTMSAGDGNKVKQAQAILTNSIIGFALTALAFVIRAIVQRALGTI